MVCEEKGRLLEELSRSHSSMSKIIEGIDLETRVYDDSDWRIRDILGHIATWDSEVSKSLRAFSIGSEYAIHEIHENETDFNVQAMKKQRDLSTQQIVILWKQAREEFKNTLRDITTDRFPGDLLYPWGDERGSIAQLVEYMIEHEEEHREEIVKAVQRSQTK